MIEALVLCFAIGLMVLLVRSISRRDVENPDELLGLFAYRNDK